MRDSPQLQRAQAAMQVAAESLRLANEQYSAFLLTAQARLHELLATGTGKAEGDAALADMRTALEGHKAEIQTCHMLLTDALLKMMEVARDALH